MENHRSIIKTFYRGVARSRVSLLGALITTAVTPFLFGLVILDVLQQIDNPYLSGFLYLLLGPLFILGLVMVFIGLFFLKGKEEVGLFTLEYLRDHFTEPIRFYRIRKLIFLGVFLTGINIFIIILLSYAGYHYTESNAFCGRLCHTVMKPEYTAYQHSPHSRVNCVECHIGAGATWFAKSKLSGIRQVFAVAFNTYSRPIETPVHGLRPARETCEECHQPEEFHGDKLEVIDKYLPDKDNTHVKTVRLMKIGSGGRVVSPRGIHWHVARDVRVIYRSTDYKRQHIPEVTSIRPDGTSVVFRSENADGEHGTTRQMDCIDCHNRPTHIFRMPARALDLKFTEGQLPEGLPYLKREALKAVRRPYESKEAAMAGIADSLRAWYQDKYPQLIAAEPKLLARAVEGSQAAWAANVFPTMGVSWNTYASQLGHGEDFDRGCARCHDGEHVSPDGRVIPVDCETCHVILAQEEPHPEILRLLNAP
jgi:hypothetical protein